MDYTASYGPMYITKGLPRLEDSGRTCTSVKVLCMSTARSLANAELGILPAAMLGAISYMLRMRTTETPLGAAG